MRGRYVMHAAFLSFQSPSLRSACCRSHEERCLGTGPALFSAQLTCWVVRPFTMQNLGAKGGRGRANELNHVTGICCLKRIYYVRSSYGSIILLKFYFCPLDSARFHQITAVK